MSLEKEARLLRNRKISLEQAMQQYRDYNRRGETAKAISAASRADTLQQLIKKSWETIDDLLDNGCTS